MKPKLLQPPGNRGSASVTAMLICLMGSVGLLGMVAIMQARTSLVESMVEQAHRQARVINGRQLAKEFIYVRVFANGSGAEATVSLPDDWGRITLPAWSANAYTTNSVSAIFNQLGPSPSGEPYVSSIMAASIFSVVDDSSSWSAPETFNFNINGQNAALAGFLLDARRPANDASTNSVTGNLVVEGRALVYQNPNQNNSFTFQADRVNAPSGTLSKSNFGVTGPARPDNYPALPLPESVTGSSYIKGSRSPIAWPEQMGSATSIIDPLTGLVQTIVQTVDASEVITPAGIDSDGLGAVTVDLGEFGLVDTIIGGPLTVLNLVGQADLGEAVAVENLAPIILVTESPSLLQVTFSGLNRRPLILVNQGDPASPPTINYTFPANADNRVFLYQEHADAVLQLAGAATVRGGIFLDGDLTVNGGTLTLTEESNPSHFQPFLPRGAWVETYRQVAASP